MIRWAASLISLISLVVLTAVFWVVNDLPASFALPSGVPVVISTSLPTPSTSTEVRAAVPASISIGQPVTVATAVHNPVFEQIVNLGVPVGNGTTPRHVALNSEARLVYILSEGIPILKQGNSLSVYDIETGKFVAHTKINQGNPTPLDLQFDPQTGLLYVLWEPDYGRNLPRTLTIIDGESLQVLQELPDVETFAAAGGLLYTVEPAGLIVRAEMEDTPSKLQQITLTPAAQRGPLAVNPITNRLYLARTSDSTWTIEIFEADTLTPLDTYLASGDILNILPNPATDEVFVVEGVDDLRVLQRLSIDGRPIARPFELGPRYTASGITLSPDGRYLYYSNGLLHPTDPEPGDETGPAFISLTTANLIHRQKIPLLTNFDDLVVDVQTDQAFAIYPFDHFLYVIDLEDEAVRVVNTAIEIRDVLVDPEIDSLYVSDSASRVRRLDAGSFATLSGIRLDAGNRYGFQYGMGAGELTLDRSRNRLYVSGNPAFVLAADTLTQIATLDPGGQFAPDPNGDEVYLSHCGVTILEAATLTGDARLPGSGPRDDEFVPNPCVGYSQLDSPNQLLFSLAPNGTPGSNSGNYLYVYDLTGPTLILTDTNISIVQALPDPTQRRAFVGKMRHTNRTLRTLVVPPDQPAHYTRQLGSAWGQTGYSPATKQLYFSDNHRLLALDADTLNVIGEMPLPPDYDYQLLALDPTNERLYLAGYDGQLLIAKGDGGASRQENLAALQAAQVLSPTAQMPAGPILELKSTANGHILARINRDKDSASEAGLFLSTDEGDSWLDLNQNLPPFPVQSIAVSSHYPEDHTLLTGLNYFGNTGGLYQSTDGGQTWAAIMTGLRDLATARLFIGPDFGPENGLIFADTLYAGLHSSPDGGQHWTPLVQLDPNEPSFSSGVGAAAIGVSDVVLASQALPEMEGVFRATVEPDGDLLDWQPVLDVPLSLLAIAPDSRITFGFGTTLWRSEDSGLTWQPGGASLSDLDRFQANRFLFSPSFADNQIVYLFFTDIRGEDSGRLYRSTNAGQTWQPWTGPPEGKLITAVTLAPNGDFLLGDSRTRVTRVSPAALRWVKPAAPSTLFPVDDVAVSPTYARDQTLFAVSHEHGLFKSTDGGQTWQHPAFPVRSTSFEGYRLALSPAYAQDQTIYVATGFSLHRSTDGGQTWQILWPQGLNLQAEAIALSPDFASDDTVLVSTPTAIWRSTERGDAWQEVLPRPEEAGRARILTFAPSGNLAYVWFDYHNTLFISEDGGQSWSARPGHPDDYFSVATGAVAPDDSLTLAAEFPPQLLQIRNLDQTWRVVTESLPEGLSNVQAMAYANDGAFLIGGQGGLFASLDEGQSWQSLNNGLPSEVTVTLLRLTDSHHFVVLPEGNILVSDDTGISWHDISVVR